MTLPLPADTTSRETDANKPSGVCDRQASVSNVDQHPQGVSSLQLIVITVMPRHPDKPQADRRA